MGMFTKKAGADTNLGKAIGSHWPEYLMEAAGLGLFMICACLFLLALEHPSSPVRRAVGSGPARRALMGIAMGLTAISLIYSPWGKRSGAHLNPAVTLTFTRLGKVNPRDAVFYVAAQFAGGVSGVLLVAALAREALARREVHYAATVPGMQGAGAAFLAEVLISFFLMSVILRVSNHERLNRFTGLFAGLLVTTFITFEAPISGMSMNPARSFASAFAAHLWRGLWIYFTAPPLGMLFAAELYRRAGRQAICAKLHHQNRYRCIFRCGYAARQASSDIPNQNYKLKGEVTCKTASL